jgi:hypothetical protein
MLVINRSVRGAFCAKLNAIVFPMPLLAPVTTA